MKTVEIKGTLRKETGKKFSKKLRKEGNVPGVLYGGKEIIHFHTPELGIKKLVFTPDVYLVKLDVEGKIYDAILQDIQFHPVTDRVIHLDFKEIVSGTDEIINVPVKLVGSAKGVLDGGRLRLRRRKLKIKGLPAKFPDVIEIDITNMEIGDTIKVGEIEYEGMEMLDPHASMVVAVASGRIAKGMEEAVIEEVAAPEEAGEAASPEEAAEEAAKGEAGDSDAAKAEGEKKEE